MDKQESEGCGGCLMFFVLMFVGLMIFTPNVLAMGPGALWLLVLLSPVLLVIAFMGNNSN